MAGTLAYRLNVVHIYQRRFDSESLAEALTSSHWYIVTRRPSTKIIADSVRLDDQIMTVDFATRADLDSEIQIYTFGSSFQELGDLSDFQVYADGAYFSVNVNGKLFHGDAWALASLLSGADSKISGQEVLYIGQAFGSGGGRNSWERTQNHKKLQRIYEDHVDSDCEIFLAPLSLESSLTSSDDHIEDTEPGPDMSAYERMFASSDGALKKTVVDLIEHSLISYFAPPYNEKLVEWRASSPTGAMRKMRAAGFRLLHVHLSGWWGLARFYSAQVPNPYRSHFISQDLPPEPRRPVLRGVAAENLSGWRFDAMLVREGNEIFAEVAEGSGTMLRAFGDEAPAIRKPPTVRLTPKNDANDVESSAREWASGEWASENAKIHEEIRKTILVARKDEQKAEESSKYSGDPSYDPAAGTIAVGEYEDGELVLWRLNDPETGAVDSALIIGNQGMGKSTQLRMVMLQAAQTGCFFIIPSDPSGRNDFYSLWSKILEDRFIATDLNSTIVNLTMANAIIDARLTAGNYSKPSREVPGILLGIDDADTVLRDDQGARLVERIISSGGKVGVGLLLVVSDIAGLESDESLMRHLVTCSNISSFMPNGYWVVEDLRARYGQLRTSTLIGDTISFVVHHGTEMTVLGLVVAVTDGRITSTEAQTWGRGLLAEHDITILDWTPLGSDPRSWWALDPLRIIFWHLRQHHDGWALIKVVSQVPCNSGADALQWANNAIKIRFEADLSSWRVGPATGEEGVLAYYADVRGDIGVKDTSEATRQWLLSRY